MASLSKSRDSAIAALNALKVALEAHRGLEAIYILSDYSNPQSSFYDREISDFIASQERFINEIGKQIESLKNDAKGSNVQRKTTLNKGKLTDEEANALAEKYDAMTTHVNRLAKDVAADKLPFMSTSDDIKTYMGNWNRAVGDTKVALTGSFASAEATKETAMKAAETRQEFSRERSTTVSKLSKTSFFGRTTRGSDEDDDQSTRSVSNPESPKAKPVLTAEEQKIWDEAAVAFVVGAIAKLNSALDDPATSEGLLREGGLKATVDAAIAEFNKQQTEQEKADIENIFTTKGLVRNDYTTLLKACLSDPARIGLVSVPTNDTVTEKWLKDIGVNDAINNYSQNTKPSFDQHPGIVQAPKLFNDLLIGLNLPLSHLQVLKAFFELLGKMLDKQEVTLLDLKSIAVVVTSVYAFMGIQPPLSFQPGVEMVRVSAMNAFLASLIKHHAAVEASLDNAIKAKQRGQELTMAILEPSNTTTATLTTGAPMPPPRNVGALSHVVIPSASVGIPPASLVTFSDAARFVSLHKQAPVMALDEKSVLSVMFSGKLGNIFIAEKGYETEKANAVYKNYLTTADHVTTAVGSIINPSTEKVKELKDALDTLRKVAEDSILHKKIDKVGDAVEYAAAKEALKTLVKEMKKDYGPPKDATSQHTNANKQ